MIKDYLLIAIFFIDLALGLIVFFRNKRHVSNQLYALYVISAAIWTLGIALFRLASDFETALMWNQLFIVSAGFIASVFLHFSLVFPLNKQVSWGQAIAIHSPNIVIILATFFSNSLIKDVVFQSWGNESILGWAYPFFGLYFVIYSLLGFWFLIRSYLASEGIKRQQVLYVLFGLSLSSAFGATFNLFFILLGNYEYIWLGPYASLIMLVFIFTSIIKYRLLNLRIALTRSLLYLLFVIITASVFTIVFYIFTTYLTAFGWNQFLVWFLLGAMLVILYEPTTKIFANLTDRIFFKNEINYQAVSKNLSFLINEEIDLRDLVAKINTGLAGALKVESADVYLRFKHRRAYVSLAHELQIEGIIDEKDANRIRVENELINFFNSTNDILVSDELDRRVYDLNPSSPEAPKLNEIMSTLIELNIQVVVPIYRESSLIGLLTVGKKKTSEPFADGDINLLQILAPQLAAALERSKLYEEVQEFNAKLQLEVEKATTNLKKANEDLQVANEHLKELDEAKSEFMSIASHQLRTPLAGIIGYLSMLVEGDYGKFTKDQDTTINEVFQASQRLVRLVNTFLNVTRIEAGRFSLAFEPTNLVNVIRSQVKEMLPTANKKDLALTFEEPEQQEMVVAVDDKIREVFLNLIDNAIKYTQTGSVNVRITITGDEFHFVCQDTGVGIREGEASKLFQKFVRGNNSARMQPDGSGLGLYIVKRIVDGHSGKIWAESEGEGKGTTFHVVLPLEQKVDQVKLEAERVV